MQKFLESESVRLDEAKAKGWTAVDMKNDWKQIFPFERAE